MKGIKEGWYVRPKESGTKKIGEEAEIMLDHNMPWFVKKMGGRTELQRFGITIWVTKEELEEKFEAVKE